MSEYPGIYETCSQQERPRELKTPIMLTALTPFVGSLSRGISGMLMNGSSLGP